MARRSFAALKWFRIAIVVGGIANLGFALPALFTPRALEGFLTIGVTNTPHWLQNVGILLVIITTMYVPVVRDPFRYLFVTCLAVAGRFAAGVLFVYGVLFMSYPDGIQALAASDLVLSGMQAVLLFFTLRAGDPRSGQLNAGNA
jgi:hypothetical protein